MNIKRNFVANYVGQAYTLGIAIVITPLYMKYLGSEPYGLVGIFALLQSLMNLLDIGISPTLGRQAAIMRGQDGSRETFWALLKSFEAIFMGIAVLMAVTIMIGSHWLVRHWINVQEMELDTVDACVKIMGIMLGLRLFSSLYRSGINGLEDHVWLNAYNIFIISVKFIGALFIVSKISNSIIHFFIYQLFIGCLELVLLMRRFYLCIQKPEASRFFEFDWRVVKSVTPFALAIAYTSCVWVFITQMDKLILSRMLSLENYGYFTLIATAANGITLSTNPISQSIKPRLTYLFSKGDQRELIKLYRNTLQLTAAISISLCSVLILYGKEILFAWTGNSKFAEWGHAPLIWFSAGNTVLSISAYTYYIQTACGNLSLHTKLSTLMAIVQVPIIYFAASHDGVIGAGIAWFCVVTFWFIAWTPIIHKRLFPAIVIPTLSKDVLPIALPIVALAMIVKFSNVSLNDESRILIILKIVLLSIMLFSIGFISSRFSRDFIKSRLRDY